jgi:hypothetical protein
MLREGEAGIWGLPECPKGVFECDLEWNVISVGSKTYASEFTANCAFSPILIFNRYANRSLRFMDVYSDSDSRKRADQSRRSTVTPHSTRVRLQLSPYLVFKLKRVFSSIT